MKHAVPNALHPLIAYQGVVLPYMLTGEIEVAIVFGLATVGPAIVGSMAVGDVYVTATFMLVLAATLIIGNIISDMLLALLDPRVRLGGSARMTDARRSRSSIPLPPDAGGPMPTPAERCRCRRRRSSTRFASGNEGYLDAGLAPLPPLGHGHDRAGAGRRCCWSIAIFGDFFAPMDPKAADLGFAPPDDISFEAPDGSFSLAAGASIRSSRPASSTPSPSSRSPGRTKTNPTPLGFFVQGYRYKLLWLIPANIHFFGVDRRPARSTCSAPTSSAATSFRAASSARAFR